MQFDVFLDTGNNINASNCETENEIQIMYTVEIVLINRCVNIAFLYNSVNDLQMKVEYKRT